MPYANAALNELIGGLVVDRIRLHSGDPGAAGTDNALGAGLSAATFTLDATGERDLATDVTVTGLAASQTVTWFSVWENAGTTFKGRFQITGGDTSANSAGEFTLKSGDTKLTVANA
jgi:hypothetical protein